MQTAFIAALAALMLASAQAQSSNGATGVVSVTSESSNNSKEPLSSSSNASPTESSQTPTPTHTPTPTPTSNTASPSSSKYIKKLLLNSLVSPPADSLYQRRVTDQVKCCFGQPYCGAVLSLTIPLFFFYELLLARACVAVKSSSSTTATDISDSSVSTTDKSVSESSRPESHHESSKSVSSPSSTASHSDHHVSSSSIVSSAASSSSVAPTRSVKPDPSVTPPHSSTTETDDNGDTPTHQLPTHAPTTRPSNPSRPTPTWTLLPTTKPDIPAPSPTSRSKQTVIAVITVVVDGSVSLSSETTVIDDGSVGYGENESDGRAESSGRPFTSTIFENGSAVVVTGNLDDPQNVNSGAMRSVAGLSMKTALAASAAALVLVAFF
ncbi:hypothetical protein GGH93_000978 [Coemansia aciculifera]|nr:hypothetical protein GGH93_000978 [Coemansia aciculifera]